MRGRHTAADRARAFGLDDREVRLLSLVARGRRNDYIAHDLSCDVPRVERELAALAAKLGVEGRGGLATWWQHRVEEAFSGVPVSCCDLTRACVECPSEVAHA